MRQPTEHEWVFPQRSMITAAPVPLQPSYASPLQPPRWQQVWREAIRDPRELLALLKLDPTSVGMSEAAAAAVPAARAAGVRDTDAGW